MVPDRSTSSKRFDRAIGGRIGLRIGQQIGQSVDRFAKKSYNSAVCGYQKSAKEDH
jgi:hypothetical protein